MFRKKIALILLTLMATLLLGGVITVYAASTSPGNFDQMEGSTIVGWGWDPSTPNTAIPVRVTVTNQETAQVVKEFHQTAAILRNDLVEHSIGNGTHGFRINVSWDTFPDGIYLIEGWAGNQKLSNTQTYAKGQAVTYEVDVVSEVPVPTPGLKSLGIYRTTAYCPCYSCSEGWGRQTSTGATARARHTIAVDPRVIPYGSKVMIDGVVYTAEDRGGGVKGKHIDIFFDTHSQTRQHGSQKKEIFLIQ